MKNVVFIFGAGASFDCTLNLATADSGAGRPSYPFPIERYNRWNESTLANEWRPPLAAQIFEPRGNFNQILDKYPHVKDVSAEFYSALGRGEDMETFLLDEIKKPALERGSILRARQFVEFTFYLKELFEGCSNKYPPLNSNFAALINKIADNDQLNVTFLTFNYDTLLERALSKYVNPKINTAERTMATYLEGRIPLIKLHGSIDWSYRIYLPSGVDNSHRWLAEHTGQLTALHPDNIRFPESGERILFAGGYGDDEDDPQSYVDFPAISIPVSSDKQFSCPTPHYEHALEALQKAHHLVTIGWRGNEQHFLQKLKEHCCPQFLTVISGTRESADGILEHLKQHLKVEGYNRTKRFNAFGNGFSGFTSMFNQATLDEYLQNFNLPNS